MARILQVARRFVPSPLTIFMLAAWIALALIAGQVLGAYLAPRVAAPDKLMGIVLGVTIGLPIFAAPRFSWEPTGWGVGINVLLLLVFGLFARSTADALQKNGDWAITWVEEHGLSERTMGLALRVTDITYRLLDMVPVAQIEQNFGISEKDIDWESLTHAARRKRLEKHTNGDLPGDLTESTKALLAEAADKRRYPHEVRQPSDAALKTMEARLLELINLERTRRGLTFLPVRQDLTRLADAHTQAMIHLGFFDHIDPQGRTPRQRAAAFLLDDSDVTELIGKVVDANDVPRALVDHFLSTRVDRLKLLRRDGRYHAMGAAIACDGPVCVSTVIFL